MQGKKKKKKGTEERKKRESIRLDGEWIDSGVRQSTNSFRILLQEKKEKKKGGGRGGKRSNQSSRRFADPKKRDVRPGHVCVALRRRDHPAIEGGKRRRKKKGGKEASKHQCALTRDEYHFTVPRGKKKERGKSENRVCSKVSTAPDNMFCRIHKKKRKKEKSQEGLTSITYLRFFPELGPPSPPREKGKRGGGKGGNRARTRISKKLISSGNPFESRGSTAVPVSTAACILPQGKKEGGGRKRGKREKGGELAANGSSKR